MNLRNRSHCEKRGSRGWGWWDPQRHFMEVPAGPASSQLPQRPPVPGACREASEQGEAIPPPVPGARNAPLCEHQIPGVTSPWGALQGGPGAAFFLSRRESGSCLSDGGARALDSRVNTPSARLQNPIFQTLSSSSPLSASRWQRPVAGQCCCLSARSARRPVRGDCIRPSPTCLCKHLWGLQLRFCFSSLADVWFNLIKLFTGLRGWMRAQ